MTGYLMNLLFEWFSGDDWSPEHKIGNYVGGFQTKASFTKTSDSRLDES